MRNTSVLAAPAEPAIENDLPLDLSCNSRRNEEVVSDDEDEELNVDCVDHRDGGLVGSSSSKGRLVVSIGGPPSPPRSPADFRALADLGYVAYHRHLMAQHWQHQQRQQQDEDDDDDDLSLVIRHSVSPPGSTTGQDSAASGDDSDSSQQPMDLAGLGVPMNPKAYKKSLMKRYCKSSSLLFSILSGPHDASERKSERRKGKARERPCPT